MASAQVVETSVTNNSPSQDSYHPDDLFQSRIKIIIIVPWLSKTQPMYESERVIAYWDIPLYAGNTHLKANRIDATIVDKENIKKYR